MNVLKAHYEKILFLGMLLIFFACMVFLLKNANIEYDLNLQEKTADYAKQDPMASDVDLDALRQAAKLLWEKPAPRTSGAVLSSDLVQFAPLALCPYCGKLVPRSAFGEGGKCPYTNCGKDLPEPSKKQKRRRHIPTEDDTDGDGMPNSYEQKYGFQSDDAGDADKDADGDGFSNYYEMVCGTDPTNARNHPPMWRRLRFTAVKKTLLPVRFAGLMTQGSSDPAKWDVQINNITVGRDGKKRESTQILRQGEQLSIEGRLYTIDRIERQLRTLTSDEERQAEIEKGNRVEGSTADESKIYLTQIVSGEMQTPDKIEMQLGQPVFSSDLRPVFCDDGLPAAVRLLGENLLAVRLGDTFTLGDRRRTGQSFYRLVSFDAKNLSARLEQLKQLPVAGRNIPDNVKDVDENGDQMIVTADGGIPEDSRIL